MMCGVLAVAMPLTAGIIGWARWRDGYRDGYISEWGNLKRDTIMFFETNSVSGTDIEIRAKKRVAKEIQIQLNSVKALP